MHSLVVVCVLATLGSVAAVRYLVKVLYLIWVVFAAVHSLVAVY